jgi:hypothetical protein
MAPIGHEQPSTKQPIMPVPLPLEQGLRPFAVLNQGVGNGLERDNAAQEPFDFAMDVLQAHFTVRSSQNRLDRRADGAELAATVWPPNRGFGSTRGLATFTSRERMNCGLKVMV